MKAAWYDRYGPAREVLVVGDFRTPSRGRAKSSFAFARPG